MRDYRVVLLVGAVLSAAILGGSACSSPDPGSITFSERPSSTGGDTSSSSSSSSSGSTTTDSGTTTTADAIFGTTAFAYTDPGVRANTQNAAHNNDVVGKDCAENAGCHGTGSDKPWTFCGTLYAPGGATIAKGEIKVVGPDNTVVGSAYTDQDGNFWYEGGASLPANSKVGVRADGVTTIQHMSTPLLATNSGCSSTSSNCHGTTQQGHVHVP